MYVSTLVLAVLALLAVVLLGAGVTLICVFRTQSRRLATKTATRKHASRDEPPH